jgi:hypothetical protein
MKRAATGLPKHSFCYPADALFDIPGRALAVLSSSQGKGRPRKTAEVSGGLRDKRDKGLKR